MVFEYRARSTTGSLVSGTVEANDRVGAIQAVERLGHVLLSVTDSTSTMRKTDDSWALYLVAYTLLGSLYMWYYWSCLYWNPCLKNMEEMSSIILAGFLMSFFGGVSIVRLTQSILGSDGKGDGLTDKNKESLPRLESVFIYSVSIIITVISIGEFHKYDKCEWYEAMFFGWLIGVILSFIVNLGIDVLFFGGRFLKTFHVEGVPEKPERNYVSYKPDYKCSRCGHIMSGFRGRCPNCNAMLYKCD